ncbi:MAG: phosphatase PAP2 family protein [Tannerella sp.]|jgi:undecaprenyl-diphosphatase|nr:phosphatase PAP2 family protein [Tannerella sp.]
MLEQELDYERNAFLLLNGGHSLFENQFYWLFSGKIFWLPLAIVFLAVLFYKHRDNWKEPLLILLAIVVVVTISDQFASSLCKPLFSRFRPTHHPDFMNYVQTVFNYRGGRYGFISSHAANAFGFATLTALIFRYNVYTLAIFLWATINSYSRIYLGVHFISDVVAGMLAGAVFGWVVYRIYIFMYKKWINRHLPSVREGNFNAPYPKKRLNIVIYTLVFSIIVILIVSSLYSNGYIQSVTIK